MPIRFRCVCAKNLQVRQEQAGSVVKCPACGRTIIVPDASQGTQRGALATLPQSDGSEKVFSIQEVLDFTSNTIKRNPRLLVPIMLAPGLILFGLPLFAVAVLSLLPEVVSDLVVLPIRIVLLVVVISCPIWFPVFFMGLIKIGLKSADSMHFGYEDFLDCFSLYFRFVGASIEYGIAVLFGSVLFLVPGILWSLKYCFVLYAVVDKRISVAKAFALSDAITEGARLRILILILCLGLANLLTIFALFPGTIVGLAYIYRKLEVQIRGQRIE